MNLFIQFPHAKKNKQPKIETAIVDVSDDGSNADVGVIVYDPFENDENNENGIDSSVGMLDDGDDDDNESDGNVAVTVTQRTIEVKPNLAYGFRDRNSSIFNRRRRTMNELIQQSQQEKRTNRTKKNPSKKNPPKKIEKKFKCDQCTYATPSRFRLKEHGQVHSKEKPFECDICKVRLSYRQGLKMHTLRSHGMILLN